MASAARRVSRTTLSSWTMGPRCPSPPSSGGPSSNSFGHALHQLGTAQAPPWSGKWADTPRGGVAWLQPCSKLQLLVLQLARQKSKIAATECVERPNSMWLQRDARPAAGTCNVQLSSNAFPQRQHQTVHHCMNDVAGAGAADAGDAAGLQRRSCCGSSQCAAQHSHFVCRDAVHDVTWHCLCSGLRVLVVRLEHNVGPAAARNAGLWTARRLGAQLACFIDADCMPEVRIFENSSNKGFVRTSQGRAPAQNSARLLGRRRLHAGGVLARISPRISPTRVLPDHPRAACRLTAQLACFTRADGTPALRICSG